MKTTTLFAILEYARTQSAGLVLVATVLCFREALIASPVLLDLLLVFSILVALAFRVSAAAFTFCSVLFDSPVTLLSTTELEIRLFHLATLVLVWRAVYSWSRSGKPKLKRSDAYSIFWIAGTVISGLFPFALANFPKGISSLSYQVEISMAFLVGFLIFREIDHPRAIRFARHAAILLSTCYLYWLTAVAFLPANLSSLLDINRSHFIFPLTGSHVGTGFFVMVAMLLGLVQVKTRTISRIDLILLLLLSMGVGSSSSRGGAIVIFTLASGIVIYAVFSKSTKRLLQGGLSLVLGLLLSAAIPLISIGNRPHTWLADFQENPVLEDTRIDLLFQGFEHLKELWMSRDLIDTLFGIGYNETRFRFGVALDAHNDVLTAAIERGLIGVVLLALPTWFFLELTSRYFHGMAILLITSWLLVGQVLVFALSGLASPVYLFIGCLFAIYLEKMRGIKWSPKDG